MLKKRILLLMYSLLLCVTASFAWIIIRDPIATQSLIVDFGSKGPNKLTVSDKNIELSVWIPGTDDFVEISNSSSNDDSLEELFKFTNVVPGHNVPFQIRIKNKTDSPITVRLSISRLECAEALLTAEIPLVYFSIMPGNAYKKNHDVKAPVDMYIELTPARLQYISKDAYSLPLYDHLQIPPTGDGYVELDCYFYFDERMDNSYQNLDFRMITIQAIE